MLKLRFNQYIMAWVTFFFLVEMLQVSLIFVSFSLTLFMFPKPVHKTSKPQHTYWQNGRC